MESLVRIECLESSPRSHPSSKRSRTSSNRSYKSPLIHLGKKKVRSNRLESLDESVVIIEDRTSLDKLRNRSSFNGKKDQSVCLDNSVIVLSDDEDKLKTIGDPELAVVTTVKKNVTTKTIRRRLTTSAHKAKVRNKKNAKRIKSTVQKCPISKHCFKFDESKLQPIAIDSEDESTVCNDDSPNSNSKAEIITVEHSSGIKKHNQTSFSLTEAVIDIVDEKSCTTELSDRRIAVGGNVSPNRPSAASESFTYSCSVPVSSESKKCSPFYVNPQGETRDYRYCQANSSEQCNTRQYEQETQNCNWNAFLKTRSNRISVVKDPIIQIDSLKEVQIGSYYTKEIINNKPGSLRDIVIDGTNIAMAYTNHNSFSEDGLKLVIDYFTLRGHVVKAFIPQHRRSSKFPLLEKLHSEGIVVFTPSRIIGGRKISSYDDRFILDYATMCDGIVVSLDQYRDLYEEKHKWRHTIEKRLLMPTFVGRCVMFPEDPLGKHGPKLDDFLKH